MKVGMIGLGGMGKPIAECIVRKGFSLTVNDVRQEQVDALVSKGAESANTPAEVAKDVRLASELAQSLSVPLMVCSAATQAWLACDAKGLQQHEMWALIEIYEELTGVRLSRPKN
tara:strand:- start:178 stop:522 length:345 start_codon:yes stop_codon:yes gene_type:complete